MSKTKGKKTTLRRQFTYLFFFIALAILFVNAIVMGYISYKMSQLDVVYKSNKENSELLEDLQNVQSCMKDYLATKGTDAMEEFYQAGDKLSILLDEYGIDLQDSDMRYMVDDIKNISLKYLELANKAVSDKRSRNVDAYSVSYEKATLEFQYASDYIYALNDMQFAENSREYGDLRNTFKMMVFISMLLLMLVLVAATLLMLRATRRITYPIEELSEKAIDISHGKFDITVEQNQSSKEIEALSKAFEQMIANIQKNIEAEKQRLATERDIKERELVMNAKYKEAQLMYLQNQVNPHFLFNTLNAGVQLAMLEGAGRTSDFISVVAEFFRYNLKKDDGTTTLYDEILLVDYYMAILKVRFGDEITMVKNLDEELISDINNINVPKMILQPLVENCVNHGLREHSGIGTITFEIYKDEDDIVIKIGDDGAGMPKAIINEIMAGTYSRPEKKGSNGVGILNVLSRVKLYYDREDAFSIYSEGEGKGTTFTIRFPYVKN